MNCACLISTAAAFALASLFCAGTAVGGGLPNAWQINHNTINPSTTLSYSNQLDAAQQIAATNSGFRFTVNARFVEDFNDEGTMTMIYGMGSRRYLIWWDLDGNNNLIARLEGGNTNVLTSNGVGSAQYHTHEIVFTNGTASYVFDGVVKASNWAGIAIPRMNGAISWGAGSSTSKGRMNFNRVTFTITNTIVASYDAGSNGVPAVAPDPETNGWTLLPPSLPPGTSVTDISPDTALLPNATTQAADQFTNTSATLNGRAKPGGSPAMAWFEWGPGTNYGNSTGPQSMGVGLLLVDFSDAILNLAAGSTYHFRAVASNVFGVDVGFDQSFTQPGFIQTDIPNLPEVAYGSVAWGDYNNDGRLDFLLTGSAPAEVSQLWRNTGSGFTNVPISGLPGVYNSSVAWGDYDNDGRLDFLLTGYNGSTGVSQLWRNTGSGFTNVPISGLPGVYNSSVAWADYDNDGQLDFLLTGQNGSTRISQLRRNTGSGFTNVPLPGVPGVASGSVAWGDYDNDGRLDFLLTGTTNSGAGTSQLWRNTGIGFSNVTASAAPGLAGASDGSVAWGDYDNDGWLDFLLTGPISGTVDSQLWRNTGSGFSNVTAGVVPGLTGVSQSSVAWGDYDNDGRLDILLTGFDDNGHRRSEVWRNNMSPFNSPPAAPAGLSAATSGKTVTLKWSPPADDVTPVAGLSYNVRIGSTPGASDLLAPMALTNGLRLLPALGNGQTGTNALQDVSRLAPGRTYYWSVQAVDTSFAGSPFAAEQPFFTAPLVVNLTHFSSGVFEFYFTNQTALNFDVLVSTNVALPVTNWLNLGPALPLGGGYYRFTDVGAIGQPKRYYLLRGQ